jgi:predicted aspartyl protease
MKVTRFSPKDDLIIVEGILWGPLEPDGRPIRLAVDTGAAETIIVPHLLDELGYNPRQGEAISVMRSAVGREEGYLIRVERFAGLGHRSRNFRVHAQDLPDGWNIEGLIGLIYLRQFNYEVRSQEGRICIERVGA